MKHSEVIHIEWMMNTLKLHNQQVHIWSSHNEAHKNWMPLVKCGKMSKYLKYKYIKQDISSLILSCFVSCYIMLANKSRIRQKHITVDKSQNADVCRNSFVLKHKSLVVFYSYVFPNQTILSCLLFIVLKILSDVWKRWNICGSVKHTILL